MVGFSVKLLQTDGSEDFANLYEELKYDLQITSAGTEGFGDDVLTVASASLSYISEKLGKLSVKLVHSLRNSMELIVLRYSSIVFRWQKRISANLSKINNDRFSERKASIVDKEQLLLRISAVQKLHHVLDNVELVCEAPVKSNSVDWRTPEFMQAYDAMMKIGFDANRFDLVKKASAVYDEARTKGTLDAHGYTVSDIEELIELIKPLAHYAQSNQAKALAKRFVDYSDKLVKYETSLREQTDLDDFERQERLSVLNIRIARLWWLSHFIKAANVLATDVVKDVLTICKIAEQCIEA
jgi:hypothetical protein